MKTHFYIATTGGPVAIQNVAPEDPEFDSVICVDGTTTSLPISASYHEFIRKPTGIIEKITGCGVYRADISQAIDGGQSWQLALFLCHMQTHFAEQEIAREDIQDGDHIILATGRMKADLTVDPVSEVPRKMTEATPWIKEWIAKGAKVTFLLPTDNYNDVKTPIKDWLGQGVHVTTIGGPSHSDVTSFAHIDDFLTGEMNCPSVRSPKSNKQILAANPATLPALKTKSRSMPILMVLAGLAAIITIYYNLPHNQTQAGNKIHQEDQPPELLLTATLTMFGGACTEEDSFDLQLKFKDKKNFKDVPLNRLCKLTAIVPHDDMLLLAVANHSGKLIPLNQTGRQWTIPLPKSRDTDRGYSLHMIKAKDKDQAKLTAKLKKTLGQMKMTHQFITEKDINDILTRGGWRVKSYSHNLHAL